MKKCITGKILGEEDEESCDGGVEVRDWKTKTTEEGRRKGVKTRKGRGGWMCQVGNKEKQILRDLIAQHESEW